MGSKNVTKAVSKPCRSGVASYPVSSRLADVKGVARAWSGVTNEPTPPEKDNADVDLDEAVAWAVVTGVTVGVLRFTIRRLSYRGSPLG